MATDPTPTLADAERALAEYERWRRGCGVVNLNKLADHLRTALTESRRLAGEVEALRAEVARLEPLAQVDVGAFGRGYKQGVAESLTACRHAADVYRGRGGRCDDYCAGVEAGAAMIGALLTPEPA